MYSVMLMMMMNMKHALLLFDVDVDGASTSQHIQGICSRGDYTISRDIHPRILLLNTMQKGKFLFCSQQEYLSSCIYRFKCLHKHNIGLRFSVFDERTTKVHTH